MKITIEIPDVALRAAVEAQVGQAIAELTGDVIRAKADQIITAKFERFSADEVANRVAKELVKVKIDDAISEVLGRSYSVARREAVASLIKEATKQALKEGLK